MRAGAFLHRSVGIMVESTDGRLLVHRRALTKDLRPGWWDIAAGGVVSAGESYELAAERELAEELGVSGVPLRRVGGLRYDSPTLHTYMKLYRVSHDGPFHFADGEVEEALFVDAAELRERLATDSFMPDSLRAGLPFVGRPSSVWSEAIVDSITRHLPTFADTERAEPMRAYMKDRFEFLGVPAPARRLGQKVAWAGLGSPPSGDDLLQAVRSLVALEPREYTYAAIDLLAKHIKHVDSADVLVDHIEPLLVTWPWWDSVDGLVGAAVGPLVRRFPDLVQVIERWSGSGDRWLVRAAILHQLHSGTTTDADRLFELCRRHAHDREFFVAKAIGWALRTYARHDPSAVVRFVDATPMQPLSRREALKHQR